MLIIPFSPFPSFRQTLSLEDVSYTFEFNWNTRGLFWSMSIYDNSSNPIVEGVVIVLNYDLLEQYQSRDVPPGKLYAIDTAGKKNRIEYEDMFNGRITLVYLLEDEEISAE